MSNDNRSHTDSSATPSNAPPKDASGKPVNVVQRDLAEHDEQTRAVDESITPSSTRTKEQEVEELNRKTAEIERKVADSH